MRILFKHALFLPCADAQPQADMCVGVSNGVVAFVGAQPPEGFDPDRQIDCHGALLMPGLVNAHTHSPLSLLRSGGEGLPLQNWLEQVIWPYEARHTAESCYWGALLNAAECIRSGITCVCDMYIHPQSVARAMSEAGLRALVTPTVTDALLEEIPNLLTQILHLREQWANHPLIRIGIAPHAVYTCGDRLLSAVAKLAERYDLPIHVHVSETAREQQDCLSQHGVTPLAHLDSFGLITPHTLMAHCVWLSDEDMDILLKHNVSVSHNPTSNLKLASGVAEVQKMIDKGINVCLGTDGASSNNNLDMFEEMKLAALLQKGILRKPTAVPAYQALKMATVNGAKALGFDDLGALKEGYLADMIILDFNRPHLTPNNDVIANLVYSANGGDVAMTIVGGKIVYRKKGSKFDE